MRGIIGRCGIVAIAVTATAAPQPSSSTPVSAFFELLNALASGAEYNGFRYFVTFLLASFTTVRLVVPPLLEWIKARRLATTVQTPDGPVKYSDLYNQAMETVLDQHVEIENLKREKNALAQRNAVLAEGYVARAIPLPQGEPPPKVTLHELEAEGAPEPAAAEKPQ